ncbi:MAG: mycothione reductase [Micropruina sp.]|nr:MAG: mycothione reductase [Micropruina sp.]
MQSFDLCVIGSGSGNSIVDEAFAEWSVALIDGGERFGGTCLNAGCIPTKMFVHPADLARTPDHARPLGVELGTARVDWPAIRDRIFDRIDPISEAGELWREQNSNVTLFREQARFVGPRRLLVGDEEITAERFVLAAGSRPRVPDLPGLADPDVAARVHTSDSVMRIDELARRLVIVGGGAVAAEFAHVFAAFGTQVTMLNRSERLLRSEDDEVAAAFTDHLASRVALRLNQRVTDVVKTDRGSLLVASVDPEGITYDFETDLVLLAIGRTPNSDRLGLETAGIDVDEVGRVVVDAQQRTTADGVFALGDLSSPWELKHVANHEARVVRHNLLHPDAMIASDHRFVPHAVFAEPQIASVGLTEAKAGELGLRYVSAVQPYGTVAYGWAMEDTDHFVKLLADPDTKQLLGAHILGPEASTLIQPLIQAMSFGLDVPSMARGQYWIHPALAEVVENALLALNLET